MTQPVTSRHREVGSHGTGRREIDGPSLRDEVSRWLMSRIQNEDAAAVAFDRAANVAFVRGSRAYAPQGLFSLKEQEDCIRDGAVTCPCDPEYLRRSPSCDPQCVVFHTDACMARSWPTHLLD